MSPHYKLRKQQISLISPGVFAHSSLTGSHSSSQAVSYNFLPLCTTTHSHLCLFENQHHWVIWACFPNRCKHYCCQTGKEQSQYDLEYQPNAERRERPSWSDGMFAEITGWLLVCKIQQDLWMKCNFKKTFFFLPTAPSAFLPCLHPAFVSSHVFNGSLNCRNN